MIRKAYIERLRRQIYGGIPTDDAEITEGMVNSFINNAIAFAAKTNYKENLQIDGIGYVNNSFYATFKNVTLTQDANDISVWAGTLPQIPVGLGKNDGVSSVQVYLKTDMSITCMALNQNQLQYVDKLPRLNGIMYWYEGDSIKLKSGFPLNEYKLKGRMVSAGDGNDLASQLNVPDDYFPMMDEYILKMLAFERAQVQDLSNDGTDVK